MRYSQDFGAPSTTRTCDLLVRSQTLYPTELWARNKPTLESNIGIRGERPTILYEPRRSQGDFALLGPLLRADDQRHAQAGEPTRAASQSRSCSSRTATTWPAARSCATILTPSARPCSNSWTKRPRRSSSRQAAQASRRGTRPTRSSATSWRSGSKDSASSSAC